MITIDKKSNCCGCFACSQICPKNCIQMVQDEEGFYYPNVDRKQCVQCHLCEKTCPILNKPELLSFQKKSYIAYVLDETIRLRSSSGGIFSLLASKVLEGGGIVFGAAFDDKFDVHHIMIDNVKDLEKLRGSKYVQSRIEDTFHMAKEELEQSKQVLFSGVACQIAGLKNYLGKEYSNLITVDVLCHGVPSPKLWDKYIKEQEKANGGHLCRAVFRDKRTGWKRYSLTMEFSNDREYSRIYGEDSYMKFFLYNICLRPSCHDCRYKGLDRPSDITLGDAWGIDKYCPEMDDNKGVSVVIVNSEKGADILNAVKGKMEIQERNLEEILPATADARRSVRPHANRNHFFKRLSRGDGVQKLEMDLKVPVWKKVVAKVQEFTE